MRLKILSPFLNNDFMKLISSLEGNTPKQCNHQGNERCFGNKREIKMARSHLGGNTPI